MALETFGFQNFRLTRHGEDVLWGKGIVYLTEGALEDGYRLGLGEAYQWDDDFAFEFHALVYPSYFESLDEPELVSLREAFCGFVLGEVHHKMLPSRSPDISAVELEIDPDQFQDEGDRGSLDRTV